MQAKDLKVGTDYAWVPNGYYWTSREARRKHDFTKVRVLDPKHVRQREIPIRTYGQSRLEAKTRTIEEKGVLVQYQDQHDGSTREALLPAREIRLPWAQWEVEREEIILHLDAVQERKKRTAQEAEADAKEIWELWPADILPPTNQHDTGRGYYRIPTKDLLTILRLLPKTD